MMNTPPFSDFSEAKKMVSYCSVCASAYLPMQTELLWEEEGAQGFHLTCKKCGHATIAVVSSTETGVNVTGVLSDLSYQDVVRFRACKAITIDDVLDAHQELMLMSQKPVVVPSSKKQRKTVVKQAKNSQTNKKGIKK